MDIHIGLKATVFFAVTGIFTLIYGILACVFLCRQKSVIDSFSRKIVIVYLVGFMGKNTLKNFTCIAKSLIWGIYCLFGEGLDVIDG